MGLDVLDVLARARNRGEGEGARPIAWRALVPPFVLGAMLMVAFHCIVVVPIQAWRERGAVGKGAAAAGGSASLGAVPAAAVVATAPVVALPKADATDNAPHEHTWRITELAKSPDVDVVTGTVGKRPLAVALAAIGVPGAEARRVFKAFDGIRSFDRAQPKDTFAVAKRKGPGGKVVAFEYATAPTEVWQAREDETGALQARKLEIVVEQKKLATAVAIDGDVRSSLAKAGLDDPESLLKVLDDALDGQVDLATVHSGARLRFLANEDVVDGAFNSFADVDAVEYLPANGDAPVRVYFYDGEDKAARGYYDAKARKPLHGGYRSPLPLARISSRFNPKRMHPVLHVVKPHNGVDFAAAPGTPIYATAPGTVTLAGNAGPCGNEVQIEHASGLVSAYCHMSRFAAGMHPGLHVEGRQLIGYVGQSGRATGPHLHFAIKRGEAFIDPLSLKLDGFRVIPPKDRDAFEQRRKDLDQALDAVPLPAPVAAPTAPPGAPAAAVAAPTPSAGAAGAEDDVMDDELEK